jgi:hypothetical protein
MATYDIHRRHEGNPNVSIHLVNRCPPQRGLLNDTKGVARACGTPSTLDIIPIGHALQPPCQ